MGSSPSSCAPCDNPCPAGFTYTESCGYWWWESDEYSCTVQENDDLVSTDAVGRGTAYATSNGCPCPVFGGCGDEIEYADECKSGETEISLETNCCDSPNLCQVCCDADYGFRQSRVCVENNDPKYVFRLERQFGESYTGKFYCPDLLWETYNEFPVCTWCDASKDTVADQGSCWLPYSQDSAGNCFAQSPTTVGWFKSSLSGEFWNGVEQYQWLASTDSGEVVLPPYSTSGRNDTTSISDDAVTTSNAHTEATAVAAVSSVLTLALVGTHRLFKKKKPASPLAGKGEPKVEMAPTSPTINPVVA
eukprot:CAMPEP_0119468456 /NCGR_PEP_ID=MMETSP1344-20130328/2202_1 /TAXON_ID=236787 /ORGANISM="Florenciella parvula, Strain CCMP2471" /LENGTH=304 /DNA_ID=CAMNT_0007500925 /DNA_START=760 /DNA_END=1674 /DNA_ORIENTATION=-